jgi:DNA-binding beta-propeller fold protein YncE
VGKARNSIVRAPATRIGRALHIAVIWASLILTGAPIVRAQSILTSLSQSGWQPRSLAYYQSGGRLLVGDQPTGKVYTFDGATLALVGTAQVGNGISALVVHQGRGLAYAYSLFDKRIAVIDASTGGFLRFLAGSYSNVAQSIGGLTIDESLDALYVLSLEGLFQFTLSTETVRKLGAVGGGQYEALAVNPVTHEAFVTRYTANELVVANGVSGATTSVAGLGGLNLGVNWRENKVYISRGGGAGVPYKVLDRDTGLVNQVFAITMRLASPSTL